MVRGWWLVLIASPVVAEPIDARCKNPPALPIAGDLMSSLGEVCEVDHAPAPLPSGVTVAIAPKSIAVKSDATTDAQVVITNTTDQAVELFIDEKIQRVDHAIHDGSGKRIDVVDQPCGELAVIRPSRSFHITLDPHRHTAVTFSVAARATRDCGKSAGPIKRGSYSLVATTPLGTLVAPLTITDKR